MSDAIDTCSAKSSANVAMVRAAANQPASVAENRRRSSAVNAPATPVAMIATKSPDAPSTRRYPTASGPYGRGNASAKAATLASMSGQ